MSSPASPLFGSWTPNANTNQPGLNLPGMVPGSPGAPPTPAPAPAGTPGSTNPYGFGSVGGGALASNLAETNLQTGTQRNALIPLFSSMMQKAGGDAATFFKMLTDLGSPFYQRKQQQTAEQGAKGAQDAAATARQQISTSGAGYTPSGTAAAAFGGEAQAEAGNQEEAFLNNLFQNEQLQTAGASGLAQIASLFNPSQLFGNTSTSIEQAQNTFAQDFGTIMSSLFGTGGGYAGVGGPKMGG